MKINFQFFLILYLFDIIEQTKTKKNLMKKKNG